MNGERSVCHELRVLNHMIKRHADAMIAMELGQEITEMQGRVIGFLHRHREQCVYQKDIEAAFSITRATTSKMLTLMEKNGLITRSGVRGDARLKQIRLTERAEAYARQIERGLIEFEQQVTGDMTDEEREALLQMLRRMQGNVCALCAEERSVSSC